ncbi:MAG: FAD-dependent monooxygenase [Beijerinckiaceae bacterium]
MTIQRPIAIAGAGIGGLTAALALAQKGFRVTLMERATRFEEVGAGLQISPNASRVLIGLGLGGALAREATAPEAVDIRRLAEPRAYAHIPLRSIAEKHGAPYWALMRADLQRVLLDAVRATPGIQILVGRSVDSMAEHADRMTVRMTTDSGAAETFDAHALIGADGVWSRVRHLVGDQTPNQFTGFEAWRALVPVETAPAYMRQPRIALAMGNGMHLVHYPVARGTMLNVVFVRRALTPREGWSNIGDPGELKGVIGDFAQPMADLMRHIPQWLVWTLNARPVAARWTRGRMTILGDAAHPVVPFLAQGAALSIEDAAVLAHEMAATPDAPDKAFARYAGQRISRTARVQKASRKNADAYHASGLMAFGRDFVMRRLGPEGLAKRYDWVYGWRP